MRAHALAHKVKLDDGFPDIKNKCILCLCVCVYTCLRVTSHICTFHIRVSSSSGWSQRSAYGCHHYHYTMTPLTVLTLPVFTFGCMWSSTSQTTRQGNVLWLLLCSFNWICDKIWLQPVTKTAIYLLNKMSKISLIEQILNFPL